MPNGRAAAAAPRRRERGDGADGFKVKGAGAAQVKGGQDGCARRVGDDGHIVDGRRKQKQEGRTQPAGQGLPLIYRTALLRSVETCV